MRNLSRKYEEIGENKKFSRIKKESNMLIHRKTCRFLDKSRENWVFSGSIKNFSRAPGSQGASEILGLREGCSCCIQCFLGLCYVCIVLSRLVSPCRFGILDSLWDIIRAQIGLLFFLTIFFPMFKRGKIIWYIYRRKIRIG